MKILAIDDNQDNLATLKAVVADRLPGACLLTVPSGPQGLELARTEDPDVILLNIVMPGMDGFEVCRRLKADQRLQPIPVVFLTAQRADRESRVKALETGAEGFLSKPLDDLELVAQVRAMAKIKVANRRQRMEKEQLTALVAERTRELEEELAEHKRTEEALKESEAKFRTIFMNNTAAMAIIEGDTTISMINEEFCKISQYKEPEVIGMSWTKLISPEDLDRLQEYNRKRLVDPQNAPKQYEFAFIRKDGQHRCCLVTVAVIPTSGKIVCSFTDITERKQAEEKIKSQLEELQRWYGITLGREGRIGELKCEVNAWAIRLGQPPPYGTAETTARKEQ